MASNLELLSEFRIKVKVLQLALVVLGLTSSLASAPTNAVLAQDVTALVSSDSDFMIPDVNPIVTDASDDAHQLIVGSGCDPNLQLGGVAAMSVMGEEAFGGELVSPGIVQGYPGLDLGMMPLAQQLPMSVYVHPRQTVRHSKRHAEIWIRLPKNSRSKVYVNFVEYPPTSDFRIFKTSLNTHEATRFYLEAHEWRDNDWHSLAGGPQLVSHQEDAGLKYIDLRPGEKRFVSFASQDAPIDDGATVDELKELTDAINALRIEVQNKATIPNQVAKKLAALESQVKKASSETAELKSYFQAAANSERVTRRFLFGEGLTNFGGHRVTKDGKFTHVDWTAFPQQISLSAPHSLQALSARPFTAIVTFYIVDADDNSPHRLPPVSVNFGDSGGSAMAQISFRQQIAQPLSDLLVERGTDVGTLHLGAIIEYKLDLGELGPVNIKGTVGNEIEVKLAP